jgi:hypothetical protein
MTRANASSPAPSASGTWHGQQPGSNPCRLVCLPRPSALAASYGRPHCRNRNDIFAMFRQRLTSGSDPIVGVFHFKGRRIVSIADYPSTEAAEFGAGSGLGQSSRRVTGGPHRGHTRATNDQITADNSVNIGPASARLPRADSASGRRSRRPSRAPWHGCGQRVVGARLGLRAAGPDDSTTATASPQRDAGGAGRRMLLCAGVDPDGCRSFRW